jgi:hypothetical protein
MYMNKEDVIRFPNMAYGTTVLELASIIHECVHAMRDLQGFYYYFSLTSGVGWATATEDEAAAYVAQALFRLYDATVPLAPIDPIYIKAVEIAKSIINVKGTVVSDADVTSIRNLVAGNPVYQSMGIKLSTPSRADGLPGVGNQGRRRSSGRP